MASNITFPNEWDDEERMHYIMSPFPPDYQPPLSDPKVTFWKDLIISSCRDMHQWSFTLNEITERLRWRGMRYRHMSVIIQGLLQGGQLKKLSDYHQKGLMEWGVNLLMAPLSWAWHRYISAPPQNEDTYLVVSLIKELCDQVILEHYKSIIHVTTDSLMSHDKFVQLIQRVAKSHDHMSSHVLEHQLLLDGRITKMTISGTNEVIVKLGSNVDSKPSPVSDTDIGIYKLMKSVDILNKKITSCQSKLLNAKTKCLEFKRNGNKNEALRQLKMYKFYLKEKNNLEQQVDNMNVIIHQIQDAETNAQVMEAYKDGVSALKKVREGLNIDAVDDLMDDMEELIDEGNEVNDALAAKDHHGYDDVDEQELLDELAKMNVSDKVSSPAAAVRPLPMGAVTPPVSGDQRKKEEEKQVDILEENKGRDKIMAKENKQKPLMLLT